MKYPFKCNVYLLEDMSEKVMINPIIFDIAEMDTFYESDDKSIIVILKSGTELNIDATFNDLVIALENYIKQRKRITLGIN